MVLIALAVALMAWPVADPCVVVDECCRDGCATDCLAFCCAGLVAVPATFELMPAVNDLREAPACASPVAPTRALEPPVRPPISC
jgi:hypothetical protein